MSNLWQTSEQIFYKIPEVINFFQFIYNYGLTTFTIIIIILILTILTLFLNAKENDVA